MVEEISDLGSKAFKEVCRVHINTTLMAVYAVPHNQCMQVSHLKLVGQDESVRAKKAQWLLTVPMWSERGAWLDGWMLLGLLL